jgi:hypothetical protein
MQSKFNTSTPRRLRPTPCLIDAGSTRASGAITTRASVPNDCDPHAEL